MATYTGVQFFCGHGVDPSSTMDQWHSVLTFTDCRRLQLNPTSKQDRNHMVRFQR